MYLTLLLAIECLTVAPKTVEIWTGECQVQRKEGRRAIERKVNELELRLEVDSKGNFTGTWAERRTDGTKASLNIEGMRTKTGLRFRVTSVESGLWTDAVNDWSGHAQIKGNKMSGRAMGKSKRVTRENLFNLEKSP